MRSNKAQTPPYRVGHNEGHFPAHIHTHGTTPVSRIVQRRTGDRHHEPTAQTNNNDPEAHRRPSAFLWERS
jgi:hypothetical protein